MGGPTRVYLIARDAYNGLLLWKRHREMQFRREDAGRTAPFYEPRSVLATDGERVFAVLEPGGPLTALDAATGETVWISDKALLGSPTDILLHDGALLVTGGKTISSLDPKTGAKKWGVKGGGNLVADEDCVFMQGKDSSTITCLDVRTGNQLWQKDCGKGVELFSCVSGVLVCRKGGVHGIVHYGFSAKDGSLLWTYKGGTGIPYVAGGGIICHFPR
jgi:hypothetical protein